MFLFQCQRFVDVHLLSTPDVVSLCEEHKQSTREEWYDNMAVVVFDIVEVSEVGTVLLFIFKN